MEAKPIYKRQKRTRWQRSIKGYISLYKNGHGIRGQRFHDIFERRKFYKEFMNIIKINGEDSWEIRILNDDPHE